MVFYANPFFLPSNSSLCSSENSTLLPCRAASRLSKRLTPGSPGEPRCSGRNRKYAHETGGVRKPRKKAVPKGQHKDPPELLTYLNALAQLLHKDQELLSSDSAAAYLRPVGAYLCMPAELQLEHHQATVGNPPTHLNAQAQLQRKDQESLSDSPPQASMLTLIPLAQVDMTSEYEGRYPIQSNHSAFYTPPKKILARSKEDDVTDISPYNHKTPPPPLQLSVDMISYAKTAIDGHTSKYNTQDHLTKKMETTTMTSRLRLMTTTRMGTTNKWSLLMMTMT